MMKTLLQSALTLLALASLTQAKQEPLKKKLLSEYKCPEHPYKVHLFSKDPLIIYITDFITKEEAAHLEAVTDGQFVRSEIADEAGQQRNATTRTSQSTRPPRDDVIRCIEERALAFQGPGTSRTRMEPFQLVKYGEGEHYHSHTDWFESDIQTTEDHGGNRATSFFVYVTAREVTGGGTNFPLLDAPAGEAWCRLVNCDEPWEAGVTFRALPGNAVFWENLNADGSGNRAVLHAGLPVSSGTKLGMNIWTRQRAMNSIYRGED